MASDNGLPSTSMAKACKGGALGNGGSGCLSKQNSLQYGSTKDGEVSFILRPPFGGLYSSLGHK